MRSSCGKRGCLAWRKGSSEGTLSLSGLLQTEWFCDSVIAYSGTAQVSRQMYAQPLRQHEIPKLKIHVTSYIVQYPVSVATDSYYIPAFLLPLYSSISHCSTFWSLQSLVLALKYSWSWPLPTFVFKGLKIEQATVISWCKLECESKNANIR